MSLITSNCLDDQFEKFPSFYFKIIRLFGSYLDHIISLSIKKKCSFSSITEAKSLSLQNLRHFFV